MKDILCRCFGLCAAFCVVFLLVGKANGQATTGLIVGQITDRTGAVITGAIITARDEDKGVTFTGRSDGSGNYVILNLTPGSYAVTVSHKGFGDAEELHAVLVIDQKLLLNFRLAPGNVTTIVEVTDRPSMLQTQTAEVGTVIGGDDITALPLLSRNFYNLTTLVPGVAQVGGSINSYALSVSGQREFANSILLDGVESTTNRTQDVTVTPSVDSVQEFKVITSSYDAEYGNAAGGVVQVQTKAGSNRYHGVAYEFFRPNFLTAKPYSFGGPEPAPTLKQHNFGGTLGGPIFKNKSFFFGSYEGSRQNNAYTYLDSTIPSSLIKTLPDGSVDLSGLVDPNAGLTPSFCNGGPCPAAGTVDPIFDPAVSYACYGGCTQQFPGNIIPANRVSAAGLNTMINFFPKPNLPGTRNGWFSNYAVDSPVTANSNQVDSRFDQVITQADRLYVIYHWGTSNSLVTDPYHGGTVVPGAGDADQANNQDNGAQSISVTEDHTFGPTKLNEFRFGYTRYYLNQYSLLNGTDYSAKYGVGNITVPGFSATVAYPYMDLADGYLAGGSTYKPYHVLDNNSQFTDYFTLTGISGHTIKLGGDFRKLNSHPNFSLFPTGFQYYSSFGTAETSDPTFNAANGYVEQVPGGWNGYGGSDIADLLLGIPEVVDIGLQLTNPHTKSWDLDFYAQDSWKATQRLTVNYGVRYEYQNPYTEANNSMSNYDVATNRILLAGLGGNSDSLVAARKNQFAPRVGFAFQLDQKTVFRGGFGIFYTPENDGREDFLTKNTPFATQSSYFNSAYDGPPLAYQLDAGVPRSTKILPPTAGGYIDPAAVPNGNLLKTYSLDPHIRTGYSESFNVAVQRQVGSSISVDLAYVGSLNHALPYQVGDINANAFDSTNSYNNRLTTDLGAIQYLTDSGFGAYNSMQLKVSKRESHNLSFLGSYTYSHNLDNGPAPFNLGHINNDNPQDPYNLRAEYASSDSDLRHNFVFSGLWYLPIGRGQRYFATWNTVTNAILGGWQLNAIYVMQSGTPVNVIRGNDPTGVLPGLRPNVVGTPSLPRGSRTLSQYFDTTAFTNAPFTGDNQLAPGDAGRNLVVGPGNINLDASIFKEVPVFDRAKLQLRMEAFNALNTPHFGNPDGNVSSGTYGEIIRQNGAANANRVVQLDVKVLF
jgi:Carboxypeptidase regulatory-like domain